MIPCLYDWVLRLMLVDFVVGSLLLILINRANKNQTAKPSGKQITVHVSVDVV